MASSALLTSVTSRSEHDVSHEMPVYLHMVHWGIMAEQWLVEKRLKKSWTNQELSRGMKNAPINYKPIYKAPV
jgi:hypothetical protein